MYEEKSCSDDVCEASETAIRKEIANELFIQAKATEKLNEVVANLEKTLESVLSGELGDKEARAEELTCTKLGGELHNNNERINQVIARIVNITRRIEL